MARWSLRSKLVTLVALALLPVLGLAAWQAEKEEAAGIDRRAAALGAVADLSVARYSGLFEASQRMLAAACADESIERAASGEAAAAACCQVAGGDSRTSWRINILPSMSYEK